MKEILAELESLGGNIYKKVFFNHGGVGGVRQHAWLGVSVGVDRFEDFAHRCHWVGKIGESLLN